jgi:hypothetical protein
MLCVCISRTRLDRGLTSSDASICELSWTLVESVHRSCIQIYCPSMSTIKVLKAMMNNIVAVLMR